jgi:hypothetical protein
VSSPASTGGAGTVFEQHVGAYWLAQLLVRAIPPVLRGCVMTEVHFQTNHLGWHTDDFLVIGEAPGGVRRQLAGQVKRTFTVSASDDECKKAIADFWRDFRAGRPFVVDTDRFALVTLRGTDTLLQHFSGLLECARASRDGADFEHRLSAFLSAKSSRQCDEIRTIIGELEGAPVAARDIWPFLRLLYVLSFDLATGTGQTEAQIKTLLAHTAGERGLEAANATWNDLIVLAATAMPEARGFRREDLPQGLQARHAVTGNPEQQVLRLLADHSALVLRNIRSTIGAEFHLSRDRVVQRLLRDLDTSQIVIVSGPAGSGKSAIAKSALALLSSDYFTFSFRAEEFAQAHFDTTLQNAHIAANGNTLAAILAGQDRKVLLIESVERLLEKSTRDAFSDLLNLAADDKSLRIVLTCRDYSTDLVRASFLSAARIGHSVVTVPALSETELTEVAGAFPTLARPLSHPPLRRVLANPYFLDKALQIPWGADLPLPESERAFRTLFWQQIVRAEDRPADGAPRRREEAFEQIAVRRARALTAYVTREGLDAGAVDSLRNDSLVATADDSDQLVAPAHDVLEDWAILQWIDAHYRRDQTFVDLAAAIGTHPAIRRSYRKWVAEILERQPEAADRLFTAAVADVAVPAQFRDDTLVSLLKAPSSPAFIDRHARELLANNKTLLKRVIQLLRVACVTTPAWLKGAKAGSALNVPEGPAWGAVLRLVQAHLDVFEPADFMPLLGLIEDWSRNVSAWNSYPDGAEAAAAIAHHLLPNFDTYREDGAGQRLLKVIAKVPAADPLRFETLLRGTRDDDERDRISETFREIIFNGLDGLPAARDLPQLVAAVARHYLLETEASLRRERFGSRLGTEIFFGIKERLSHSYFPASAIRGPWLTLIREHRDIGLEFVIAVFNYSIDWYVHPRVRDRLEPAAEIELRFADGTTRRQWVNGRLWNLYRGTSVGPYVLQSILMALERFLFEVGEERPAELDGILVDILRRSDSGALTGLVAGVATRFPHASGEALLVLLRSPMLIRLDSQRVVTESQSTSRLLDWMPGRAEHKIYNGERKEADGLPHRRSHLETAILNLQLGPFARRVHQIIDEHRAALPPVEAQTEGNRLWRLAMHRMDLRGYTAAEEVVEQTAEASNVEPQRRIRLEPVAPEPDVQEMVDGSAARFAAMNERLGLALWGSKVFEGDLGQGYDPSQWRERLAQARAMDFTGLDEMESRMSGKGPGLVAAVCVRDHWAEMSQEEREWCVSGVCAEIMETADIWDEMQRMQRNPMDSDRACAFVVPLLLGKDLSGAQTMAVRQAFAAALTHPTEEVRWHAIHGIGRNLWGIDRSLALRCVNALAVEATFVDAARRREEERPYRERRHDFTADAARAIRARFWTEGAIAENAYEVMDIDDWFGAEANAQILTILLPHSNDAFAIAGFRRSAAILAEWWVSDEDERRGRGDRRRDHRIEAKTAISERIQRFVLQATPEVASTILQPILDTVDRDPRDLQDFVRGMTSAEVRQSNPPQFWFIWDLFAERLRRAPWIARVGQRYSSGDELVAAVFLRWYWDDNTRHWESLEGYAERIDRLFLDLPATSTVLDEYVGFLYHIGERSLPAAFSLLAQRLQAGAAQEMLKSKNTVFMLEVLLQRHVYGRPLELKREPMIRDAVLYLLDTLVDSGSSAAFRMRDDFVTPLSG